MDFGMRLVKNPIGATQRIVRIRNIFKEGMEVAALERLSKPGVNPTSDCSCDRYEERIWRNYIVEKKYERFAVLRTPDGSRRRSMLYFDFLKFGRLGHGTSF